VIAEFFAYDGAMAYPAETALRIFSRNV
jgi:hypothetical protein